MKVTVIMPVRNAAHHLAIAWRAVQHQHRAADEVIVVTDPTSTDDTASVVADVCLGSTTRIVEQPGAGIADAINAGLACSNGDIIMFASADDALMSDAIAAHLSALEAHPEAGYSVGKVAYFVDEQTGPPLGWRPELLDGPRHARMIETTAIRRSTFEAVGLHRSFAGASSDVDFFARSNDAGVVSCFVDAVVVRKRLHSASTAHTSASASQDLLATLHATIRRKRSDP